MENKNINFFFLKNSTETSNILLGTFSSEFLGLILINLIFAILIIFFLIKHTAVNQTEKSILSYISPKSYNYHKTGNFAKDYYHAVHLKIYCPLKLVD